MHASRLAQELELPRIIVPPHPGILCAIGLLLTDLQTNYARTRLAPSKPVASAHRGDLRRSVRASA
ncbi:MAG: hydantoinase/oxoprolinase family protein [Geminicoccaceae bacterium]